MADENTEGVSGGNVTPTTTVAPATATNSVDGNAVAGDAGVTASNTAETGTTAAQGSEETKAAETSTETKPEGEQKPEGEKSEVEGAPDEYKDFSLPEGAQADAEAMTEFKNFAKSENLTQDQAQKYVDLHVRAIDKVLAGQQERWNALKEDWRTQTLADKELHGADGKADEAISIAKSAVTKLGGEALQMELDRLGVSNNPLLVKAFYKAGKAMQDDDFVFGGGSGDTRSPAQKLFPSMKGGGQ